MLCTFLVDNILVFTVNCDCMLLGFFVCFHTETSHTVLIEDVWCKVIGHWKYHGTICKASRNLKRREERRDRFMEKNIYARICGTNRTFWWINDGLMFTSTKGNNVAVIVGYMFSFFMCDVKNHEFPLQRDSTYYRISQLYNILVDAKNQEQIQPTIRTP